jgi:hypothetical protein
MQERLRGGRAQSKSHPAFERNNHGLEILQHPVLIAFASVPIPKFVSFAEPRF